MTIFWKIFTKGKKKNKPKHIRPVSSLEGKQWLRCNTKSVFSCMRSTFPNLSWSLRWWPVKATVTPHRGLPRQSCTGETHQYLRADNHLSQFDLTPSKSRSPTFLHLAGLFPRSCLSRAINYPAAGSKHQQQQRAAQPAAVMETDEDSSAALALADEAVTTSIFCHTSKAMPPKASSHRSALVRVLSGEMGSCGILCV